MRRKRIHDRYGYIHHTAPLETVTIENNIDDINAELGITLAGNTTYQYEFFIVNDGVNYITDGQSFKTN